MITTRRAAVAGYFYPDQPGELGSMLDSMLAAATPPQHDAAPVAIIVPHAGYVYSGPVAASAYASLSPWRDAIRRVLVVGPPHRVPVRGVALSGADSFETPLGRIPLDGAARDLLLTRPWVYVDDIAHAHEHSIEVHLPFLQRVLGDQWSLVPALAGEAPAETIADVLEPLWGTPGTLVVISTDLSHYHDHHTAARLDAATAAEIVAGRWERLHGDDACGAVGVRGALAMAGRRHQQVTLLDLRSSGDTAGPTDRVVGYGSFEIR
jgi:AmmeMemoRadiSam system protein B